MILFFDTETTGFAQLRQPATSREQPFLLQLGAILCEDDEALTTRAQVDLLVMPPDFMQQVPDGAYEAHGISAETARRAGVHIDHALGVFMALCASARIVVGFNLPFDEKVIDAAACRQDYDGARAEGRWPHWPAAAACVMAASREICKLPFPSGRAGFKYPKLTEAYEILIGEPMWGAHNAYVDALATRDVYSSLRSMGVMPG